MITATRKIGQNRGKPRLLIEGKLLVDAGLPPGTKWHIRYIGTGFVIEKDVMLGKRRVSGKPDRPVIDIAGSTLGQLGEQATVTLTYHPGSGQIRIDVE